MKCNSLYACLLLGGAGVGVCPAPGLELPHRVQELVWGRVLFLDWNYPHRVQEDLGAVPVAEMMDNLWITVSRHGTCFWDSRSCMCTRCEKSEKEGKAYVLC